MNYPALQLETRLVGHLPVIRAIIDELGIAEVIAARSPPHVLSRVSDAECAVLMILNVLSGRVALFRMNEWLGHSDASLLLGEGVPADGFDDSRLATALDHLDAVGTDVLLADVVARFLARPDRPSTYSVHQDTTSLSVYGDYEGVEGLVPTWGYSKDHRPDLKQLVFGMALHGAVGMPLVARLMDGNTSDVTANRDLLADLAQQLPEDDEVTIVADCKLVDGGTLGRLLSQGFHVVSLLPDTFSLRSELIEAAYAERPAPETWPVLEEKPGKRKADPALFYRGASVTRSFPVELVKPAEAEQAEQRVTSWEEIRFLVVHSDTLAQSFEASLPDRIQKEKEACEEAIGRLDKKPFRCADDALAAARRATARTRWHQVQLVATPVVRELPRPRRGRCSPAPP